jgi:pimeloyl-ACP methyl ester carboxylesterase
MRRSGARWPAGRRPVLDRAAQRPAAGIAARQPTVWVLPEISRFVPAEAQRNLKKDVGERAVVVFPDVGHSIHRDSPRAFVDIVTRLSEGR